MPVKKFLNTIYFVTLRLAFYAMWQCAVVLRVGTTLKLKRAFAKFVCFVEFYSDVYLPKYIRQFSEHNKI